MHIPRTGGGSVTSAISRAYGRARSAGNVQLSADKSHRLFQRIAEDPDAWGGRALADHVPYGLYARYLPPDTRYITFLRDPVERVLSHYHFHAQAGPEKLRTIWRRERAATGEDAAGAWDENDVSLETGLARGITIYNNFATRFLWGGESLEGELPPDALERAKENLDRFFFVGVTERLDEAVIMLARMLAVPLDGYHLRHVREGRPKASEVPDSLIRRIEEHNAFDIELYRIARERFNAQAEAAGDVTGQVEELTQRRAEVTEEAEARRVARKTAGKARRRAAKIEKRRPRRDLPDAEPGTDDLQDEPAALQDRMHTIEAALATAGDEQPGGDRLGETGTPGRHGPKRAARRGLQVPWRRRRRQQRPGADMTETQPVEPRADDEQSRETEEPLPAGKAAKRERRAARRGGSQRQRKARKQGAAATPADGEQSGGRRRRKARQQLPDATTDHTDEPETGPHRTADAA